MSDDKDSNYSGVWDNLIGFGDKPALIVIDFLKGYTTQNAPLFAAGVVEAVKQAPELIDAARAKGIPVLHTNVRYTPPGFADSGIWTKKAPVLRDLYEGNPLAEFCDEVPPAEGEIVISKQYASAFFGTSLQSTLTGMGVDTLIIAGCTTSGCIRASAVDSLQHGFHTIVVRDCVGDRHDDPHEANLFDIHAKYGDVLMKADVIAHLNTL